MTKRKYVSSSLADSAVDTNVQLSEFGRKVANHAADFEERLAPRKLVCSNNFYPHPKEDFTIVVLMMNLPAGEDTEALQAELQHSLLESLSKSVNDA